MSSSTLHKWIKKHTEVKVSETEAMTVSEIKKLQKRLALLEEENIILKKAMAIFHKGIKERVEVINRLSANHNIRFLCQMLKVAKSTYYNNINRKLSSRKIENDKLKSLIQKIFIDSKKRYGCTKIMRILHKSGFPKISLGRVSRLMK